MRPRRMVGMRRMMRVAMHMITGLPVRIVPMIILVMIVMMVVPVMSVIVAMWTVCRSRRCGSRLTEGNYRTKNENGKNRDYFHILLGFGCEIILTKAIKMP